jgi:small-conductance mechanosensitive channel
MYFKILIFGTVILLLFRILSYLNKTLPLSKNIKHYSGYLLPILELVSWVGFAIWCLHHIYDEEAFTTFIILGILIALLIAPAWFLIRDFLHGMFLKIQRKIEIDTKIEIGNLKGIIVKTDYFTFDIKTKDGNINTIPYNKIRSDIISKNAGNIHLEKQLLSFIIPSKHDINKTIPELKTMLVNAPWVAASQDPIINNIRVEADNSVVEVIVYMLKKEHTEKIVDYVKKNFIDKLS